MAAHTRFGIGQLVRVTDTRNPAYGRIAMVMMSGKGRSQVRFADLPKDVAASPNPAGFVEGFGNDQLEAIEGMPVAVAYALVTVTDRVNSQGHKHHCLAHAEMGQDIRVVAQAIAQNWSLIEGDISHEYEEIALADYAVLSKVLEDKTPPF
jgi:hypothetical protein